MLTACDPPAAARPDLEEVLAAAIVEAVAETSRVILRSREDILACFAALPDPDLDDATTTR